MHFAGARTASAHPGSATVGNSGTRKPLHREGERKRRRNTALMEMRSLMHAAKFSDIHATILNDVLDVGIAFFFTI